MANADEMQRRAREAYEAYIRDHLVAIDQYDATGRRFIGSATCIEIGGRIFLCTAAHNFKGIPGGGRVVFSSTRPGSGPALITVGENYGGYGKEGTPDTAWVEIDRESADRAKLVGVSLDAIDAHHMMDPEHGAFAMVGLPADFYKITSNPVPENVPILVYYTKPGKQANEMDDRLFLEYSPKAQTVQGSVFDMPHPGGISGGGIWLVPRLEKDEVWSPYRYRLVGLNIEYDKGQIVGMRMHHWLKLVLGDHPELSEHIEPVLVRKS